MRGHIAMLTAVALFEGATVHAADPDELIARYAGQAQVDDPAFTGFSAERGRAFYYAKHPIRGLGAVSCASCHRKDPREEILAHRTDILCRACHVIYDEEHPNPAEAKKRLIYAFAPAANSERFRDADRVERYFETNCRLLLGRECTVQEKGDLIAWLLTIEGPAIPPTYARGDDPESKE